MRCDAVSSNVTQFRLKHARTRNDALLIRDQVLIKPNRVSTRVGPSSSGVVFSVWAAKAVRDAVLMRIMVSC